MVLDEDDEENDKNANEEWKQDNDSEENIKDDDEVVENGRESNAS
jgi:hypothetical protein